MQIRPGVGSQENASHDVAGRGRNVTTADTLMDLVRNCFPPNIVQATMQQYRTTLVYPGPGKKDMGGYMIDEQDKDTWMFKGDWSSSTNILGLVVFSIVTGVAIAAVGEDGVPLLRFFQVTKKLYSHRPLYYKLYLYF